MLDVNGMGHSAGAAVPEAGHQPDASPSAGPSVHENLERGWRLNREGDGCYYDGGWNVARHAFEKALELGNRVAARGGVSSSGTDDAWRLVSTAARNLAMLCWLSGDHESVQAFLDRAVTSVQPVSDARTRWYLHTDLEMFAVLRQRTAGHTAAARKRLDALQPLEDDPNTAVYLELRRLAELANLSRQDGDFDGSLRHLLRLSSTLADIPKGDGAWAPETLDVHRNIAAHYRLVTQVERVLFLGLAGRADQPGVDQALAQVMDWRVHRSDSPSPAFRHHQLRVRKVSGWVECFIGHPRALATATDVAQEAGYLPDWRTRCLASCQRAAAMLAAGDHGAALAPAGKAFELAMENDYWKGRLLAAVLARQACVMSGNDAEAQTWSGRLQATAQAGEGRLPTLVGAGRSDSAATPLGVSVMRESVRRATAAAAEWGLPAGSLKVPETQGLMRFGPDLTPVVAAQLDLDPGEWPTFLRQLTRADPLDGVPEEGMSMRRVWQEWYRDWAA